jgi:hypothetical protein
VPGLIARKATRAALADSCRMTASDKRKPAAAPPHPSRRLLKPRGAARVIPEAPVAAPSDDDGIVAHPDGYYWLGPDLDAEFGPFDSRSAALADRDRYSEEAPSEGETVQEAEREIGVNDWIDAETGGPAEGQSPPHLEEP